MEAPRQTPNPGQQAKTKQPEQAGNGLAERAGDRRKESDQQAEDQLDQAAQNTEQKQSDEDGHFPTPQEMGRLGIR